MENPRYHFPAKIIFPGIWTVWILMSTFIHDLIIECQGFGVYMSRLVISQKLINEPKSSTTTFINKDSNTFVHFTDPDTKHKTSMLSLH